MTLARLMVGAASLATARLSVVIGAISQSFGGPYQDPFPFAGYLRRHRTRPLPAVPCERKGDWSMAQSIASPTPSEVKAFMGQVITDLSAAFSGVLVNVGRRLGLYQ